MSTPYNVQLLNDLHNHFPDILYQPQRFQSVQDVIFYIISVANRNPYQHAISQTNRSSQASLYPRQEQHSYMTSSRASSLRDPLQRSPEQIQQIRNLYQRSEDFDTVDPLLSNFINRLFSTGAVSIHAVQEPLENVVVRPTQAQIERSTTVVPIITNYDDNCAICQDELVAGQTLRSINHCSHIFHQTCIDTWFQRNVRCPSCRFDIRDDAQ
jgi:hypothetical protein